MPGTPPPTLTAAPLARRPIRDIAIAAVALGVIVVASAWVADAAQRGELDPAVADTLSYVLVWVPLLLAVAVSCTPQTLGPLRERLALHARPVDFAWGLGAGLFARAVVLLSTVAITGQTGLSSSPTIDVDAQGWYTVEVIVFLVVIGPLIEEVFFRGFLQQAIEAACRMRAPAPLAAATAVGVSSLLFATMHLILEGSPLLSQAVTLGIGTLVVGVVSGTIVACTRRLTGAIVAHVVFNAIAVALTWPH